MTTVIPFIHRLADQTRDKWLASINALLVDIRVSDASSLTAQQKKHAPMAIIANPDASQLAGFDNLHWLQSIWAGVDSIITDPGLSHLPIARLHDPQLAALMAQSVLAWTLYLHCQMPRYARQQQQQQWQQHMPRFTNQCNVSVLGLGEMGQQAALRLKDNGFNVRGWSRSPKQLKDINCFAGDHTLPEMLADTDILVCLLPLTPQTRHLLNSTTLGYLPNGAQLINFGRGAIVSEPDVISLLDKGHLQHAVLDVFEKEPLPVNHPFWQHPQITVLPHISAPTPVDSASKIVARQVEQYLQHGKLPDMVSRQRGY